VLSTALPKNLRIGKEAIINNQKFCLTVPEWQLQGLMAK
jgi:hypothetical protein